MLFGQSSSYDNRIIANEKYLLYSTQYFCTVCVSVFSRQTVDSFEISMFCTLYSIRYVWCLLEFGAM